MAGQIFYRERLNAREGSKTPRYRIVAVSGIDLKVYADHLRMAELKQLALATKADLVSLQRGPKHNELVNKQKAEDIAL
ncbi:MAG: hypothetical protein PHI97_17010 [Desulfobulbus sp.]|nr:hypothetical protein [Desulfobulbus sp.]